MARHAARRNSPAARTLLRAGLTLGAAGAALAAGAAGASAAPTGAEAKGDVSGSGTKVSAPDVPTALDSITGLQINPLANTGVDPLDNGVETQVADFKPVGTRTVTGPLSEGASLSELPVVGKLLARG
ncbi:hypothetical protein HUT18_09600 [Streptomyces sp. NA04227]|uniref:hypothetical protein n=1 Tax=Streptomyces sp. NA04227 TaxID=2742136 RepID=UPI001591EC4C|nr:hypothetical protein [Streptomyces sp. NA04227]QKW06620.1 hypothetical protein HUT18_09600 [Streptomyces sp. NA04227]